MEENIWTEGLKKYPFLIMAHRGVWGGNIIENTIQAAALAFDSGADIVEIDVCRTSDGRYYLFHDQSEPRLLGKKNHFHTLSSNEINQCAVYNSIGSVSGYTLNTLSEFLKWLPENKLVNIDRSWKYWEDESFFALLKQSGKEKQVMLKSPVKKEFLDRFSKHGSHLFYMPIIHKAEEWTFVQSYDQIKTIGAELIVEHLTSPFLKDQSWLKESTEKRIIKVANAEKLGKDFNLFGGESDDVALFNKDKWVAFLDAGVDIIQTDWPYFLNIFREKML